jgi:hypothetical protein
VIKLPVVVCSASQFVGYYSSKRPPALLCREKGSILRNSRFSSSVCPMMYRNTPIFIKEYMNKCWPLCIRINIEHHEIGARHFFRFRCFAFFKCASATTITQAHWTERNKDILKTTLFYERRLTCLLHASVKVFQSCQIFHKKLITYLPEVVSGYLF